MNMVEATARVIRRAASSFAVLSILLARVASGELVQVDVVGTVDFLGCPSAISCSSFPLMWGISGGESMTLRMVYDSDAPLAGDLSTSEAFLMTYEHALPLQSPLGVQVTFGPYDADVGSAGVEPDKYGISVFDVIIPFPNYPDLSEAIGITITVPPLGVNLPGPPGFHDLDLSGIAFSFQNFYSEDFLNGGSIPIGFPSFNWENTLLTVAVYDPVYDRNGTAFLEVDSLTLSTPLSVPGLTTGGLLLLASGLLVVAWSFLTGIRTVDAGSR
ncbi:MAG: hypothetical protein JRS35_27370 [Deltaproteobacteria bacterium]|nr:hypothetical protein [Deltaproteobacteria bacterium]